MNSERFRQIEELFHAVREANGEQRATLLARADPEVRREIELLLWDSSGCEFLDRSAIENAPELLAESATNSLGAGSQLSLATCQLDQHGRLWLTHYRIKQCSHS